MANRAGGSQPHLSDCEDDSQMDVLSESVGAHQLQKVKNKRPASGALSTPRPKRIVGPKTNGATDTPSPTPIHNRFAALAQIHQPTKPLALVLAPSERKVKSPPPITITSAWRDVAADIAGLQIDYTVKLLNSCTKVYSAEESNRTAIVNLLVKKKAEFYTHAPEGLSKLRLVLKDMPNDAEPSDITDELTKLEIAPMDVRPIPTRGNRNFFAVDFDRQHHTLASVSQKAKYIMHFRARWEKARNRAGPIICRKCAMPGHAAQFCNRGPVCCLCACNHTAAECPLTASTEQQQQNYRCTNCKNAGLPDNHRADDTNCPTRAKYSEWQRAQSARRTNGNNNNSKNKMNNTFNTNSSLWPSINRINTDLSNRPPPTMHSNQCKPVFAAVSYRNAVLAGQNARSGSNNNANNPMLFPVGELMNMMIQSIDRLENCTSKLQQLRVVADLLQQCLD